MKDFFGRKSQPLPQGKKIKQVEEHQHPQDTTRVPLSKFQAFFSVNSPFSSLSKAQPSMEKHRPVIVLICPVIVFLGFVSFASCIGAELKRTKKKDLKLDGKLCYLPGSCAFGLGVAALICLFAAQIIGNLVICRQLCLGEKRSCCNAGKPKIASILLVMSWISFGITVILMGTATSMNRRQPYGKGWLDGECYLVRDGVCIGSAMVVLVTITSMLGSVILMARKSQLEQGWKVHAQAA